MIQQRGYSNENKMISWDKLLKKKEKVEIAVQIK